MSNNFVTYPGIQEMYIGKPIPNVSGPFAGRTIRSQLEECQKPDLGRKFAKRDRRPVDPPPVIRLRMFEVLDEGTENQREEELPAESIETIGLVAHVDLFAAKPPPRTGFGSLEGAMQISPNSEYNSYNRGIGGQQDQIDESLLVVDENEVLTSAAFGSTFAHAVTIRDLKGESVVYFVFPDISVKIEGHFVLRYRCCNLRSRVAGSDDVPIMAELRR
ncbi:hypothetical protein BN14_06019 [Rhizoctonia solani AG-1 IB]|uniref:Velvet domain-containing protein n=2 Tax=Rhizoctonia solani TaxID=456999 RepID=A0A8H3BM67_9AGAM|nr:unnamed protein product [Rhizoctonia solani]CCO31967.1 hypothetical protein BN14_06019 [Rhizoctonia solani AG-1 IB]